jgi:DNA-binding XRE family transcriptional regulator
MIVRPRPIDETSDTITFTRADVDRLFEQLEDLEARAAYTATREEEKLPAQIVRRLCAGESPVRVIREYRGLTMAELTQKAGLSLAHLSAIESGTRPPSAKSLAALATALDVSVDDLSP